MRGDGTALGGADLEAGVARFLELHGYAARRNTVLEGRSGARHEIDVLAEKADGVTTFRLAVECKAWRRPIDKDVVAKLAYVMADLGIHKGAVVALSGWRLGAERSAAELGIELWGPDELEARLGQVAVAGLRAGPARRLADALPLRLAHPEAERLVTRESRGRLLLGRERVAWIELVWVPVHLLEVVTSRPDTGFLRRQGLKSTWSWNLYEAVTGRFVDSTPRPPVLGEEDVGLAVPPAVPVSRIVAAIRRAAARRDEVTSSVARDRHTARLVELGIPADAAAVTVEAAAAVHQPLYLGLAQRAGKARLVAVDAHAGAVSPMWTEVLTGAMGYVLQALEEAPPRP